jgi:lambda family phage minor tail protein L
MSDIHTVSASLSPDAPITLFIIDATNLGGDIEYGTTAGRDVTFDGQVYTHYSAQMDGFGIREDGESDGPTVRIVPNVWLKTFVNNYDDGRGAVFKRIRTYARFLDDGDEPDPTQTFPMEVYYVERMSRKDEAFIEWELSNILDLEGLTFPLRRVLSDHCDYTYRSWNGTDFVYSTCPYAGVSMWNRFDEVTVDPTQDHCANKFSGCRLRFAPEPLPFRGFPGASRVG